MCQPVLVLHTQHTTSKANYSYPVCGVPTNSTWLHSQMSIAACHLQWLRKAIPFCQSQHFPASCFQSEHFPIWTFSIWVFPIWTFPIWVFPKSEMKKFEHFQFENFQSWYDMLQPSAKSVKLAIHWNCQLLWMTWFASNEKWMTTPPACKLSK